MWVCENNGALTCRYCPYSYVVVQVETEGTLFQLLNQLIFSAVIYLLSILIVSDPEADILMIT